VISECPKYTSEGVGGQRQRYPQLNIPSWSVLQQDLFCFGSGVKKERKKNRFMGGHRDSLNLGAVGSVGSELLDLRPVFFVEKYNLPITKKTNTQTHHGLEVSAVCHGKSHCHKSDETKLNVKRREDASMRTVELNSTVPQLLARALMYIAEPFIRKIRLPSIHSGS
jgi:hypothetical protein